MHMSKIRDSVPQPGGLSLGSAPELRSLTHNLPAVGSSRYVAYIADPAVNVGIGLINIACMTRGSNACQWTFKKNGYSLTIDEYSTQSHAWQPETESVKTRTGSNLANRDPIVLIAPYSRAVT